MAEKTHRARKLLRRTAKINKTSRFHLRLEENARAVDAYEGIAGRTVHFGYFILMKARGEPYRLFLGPHD
jgi:hypothetical protein